MYYVGIDFGTTNSSLAVMKTDTGDVEVVKLEGGYEPNRQILRTVLYFPPNGDPTAEETMAFQETARSLFSLKRKIMDDPSFSFEVDGVTYQADELVMFFLRDLLKRANIPIEEISRLVLSVPTLYGEEEKNLMERACRRLGIRSDQVWFIDEPIAVLWDYKDQLMNEELIMVFDFGGGTLDLAVMEKDQNLEGINTAASILKQQLSKQGEGVNWKKGQILAKIGVNIGGDHLDEVIIKYLIEEGKKQDNPVCMALDLSLFDDHERLNRFRKNEIYPRLKKTAERVKIMLSDEENYIFSMPPIVPKVDRNGLRNIQLSREDFEKRCQPIWDAIADGIRELGKQLQQLHGFGLERIGAVLLSGGSSLVPKVQDIIEEWVPNARLGFDPHLQTSICRGNALYSYHDGEILVDDQINAAYGIYNHKDRDTVTVIKETDMYPIQIKKRIATTKPNQEYIEIIPMVRKGSDFEPIKKAGSPIFYRMKIRPLRKSHDLSRITVTFSIDKSQRLTISAFDNAYKETIGVEEVDLSDL